MRGCFWVAEKVLQMVRRMASRWGTLEAVRMADEWAHGYTAGKMERLSDKKQVALTDFQRVERWDSAGIEKRD